MNFVRQTTRRQFIRAASAAALAPLSHRNFAAEAAPAEPVIDIHQHTDYLGRTDADLVSHQRAMGVRHTILLPAGRFFGLEAGCSGNDRVMEVARNFPGEFSFFANEVPYLSDAPPELRRVLRAGGMGIGEQKFMVDADSRAIHLVAEIAQEFNVPVLLHFQSQRYNTSYERFPRILEKFPKVNFIGHAQTFWANIDAEIDQKILYPMGPVTPGGLTDRFLTDYPNFYGDMSAGSGLNAMQRDEGHARAFMARHADKLMFGSDCVDREGQGEKCTGSQMIATIRRLAPSKEIERKLLNENAQRLLKLAEV